MRVGKASTIQRQKAQSNKNDIPTFKTLLLETEKLAWFW